MPSIGCIRDYSPQSLCREYFNCCWNGFCATLIQMRRKCCPQMSHCGTFPSLPLCSQCAPSIYILTPHLTSKSIALHFRFLCGLKVNCETQANLISTVSFAHHMDLCFFVVVVLVLTVDWRSFKNGSCIGSERNDQCCFNKCQR